MEPDYEPRDVRYPEWEGEIQTSDNKNWWVVVTVMKEIAPGCKPHYYIPSHEAQIFDDMGEEYSQDALVGEPLLTWLEKYGTEVALLVSEKIHDEEINRHEEMCWGD